MKEIFTKTKIRILLHILAWSVLLGFPIYTIQRGHFSSYFIWYYYISTIIYGIIFYINYFVLVPRFFFDNRRSRYFISVIVLLTVFYFASTATHQIVFPDSEKMSQNNRKEEFSKPPDRRLPPIPGILFLRPPFRQAHLYNYTFTSLFLVFFSIGLRILERNAQIEKSQKELEREKLNSELALLKNQISPHFFFNTLNNIYSLITINAEDSKKAVLQLSKLMRYLLYESEHGDTRLSHEIDFMNNYIDLMKLRMTDKVSLKVNFPSQYDDINIPPLLFIPFIENAFKHGITYRGNSFIDISMSADKNSVTFRCVNSNGKKGDENGKERTGIGLENVKKRLSLLFPGMHELRINKTEMEYEVYLYIKFSR